MRAEKIYTIMKMRYSNHNYQLPLIIIYRFSDDARRNVDEVPGNAKQQTMWIFIFTGRTVLCNGAGRLKKRMLY